MFVVDLSVFVACCCLVVVSCVLFRVVHSWLVLLVVSCVVYMSWVVFVSLALFSSVVCFTYHVYCSCVLTWILLFPVCGVVVGCLLFDG